MIVALHFLHSYTGTVKLLSSLLLYFFDFSLKTFMLILSEHVPELILKILNIISIFLYLETVSKS